MNGSRFSPKELRGILLGETGYSSAMRLGLDSAREARGVGNVAGSDAGMAIECLLVGLDEPALQLLTRAGEWVRRSIEAEERPMHYFPGWTEAYRFEVLMMCEWLLHDRQDEEAARLCVAQQDRYLASSRASRDKVAVSSALTRYLIARAYQRALEVFEQTRGLSPPPSLATIRGEARMAYVISRYRLGLEYTAEEVEAATRSFLTRNVGQWLSHGQSLRVAEWMKIVYWDPAPETLTAKQALLKAYDHLPGCEPPQNLARD